MGENKHAKFGLKHTGQWALCGSIWGTARKGLEIAVF
jgi:hypothetical protein